MTAPEVEWKPRLRALVDRLTRRGDVRSGSWQAAFEETPRHVFVPTVIALSDGSHAEVITDPELDGQRPLIQAGPRRLWDSVEAAHELWRHLGQPGPSHFGVVANRITQFVWFDTDEGWYRWPLPLA